MTKQQGIIIILAGIGLFTISFLFSSGSSHRRSFISNISRMEIVLVKETVTPLQGQYTSEGYQKVQYHDDEIALPLKYPLALSVMLVLVGAGAILTSKGKTIANEKEVKDNHTQQFDISHENKKNSTTPNIVDPNNWTAC